MNLEKVLTGINTLTDIGAPLYQQLNARFIDDVTALKIFLQSQTVVLTKAVIRTQIPGGYENLDVSDEKIINNLPINIQGEKFSAKSIADQLLSRGKANIIGYTDFIKDVLILSRLATNLESLSNVDCKFTKEILQLLNTRSDVTIFREIKFDKNLVIYFLNNEYLIITNRGLMARKDANELTTPSTTQEFFVTIFRLSSILESYMSSSSGGFRGTKIKQLKVAKLETYESTMRESKIDSQMVFNSRVGPCGRIHWFFNDGLSTRRERLTASYLLVDNNSPFSMADEEWERYRAEFGIPDFTKELILSITSSKKGTKSATYTRF